MRVYPWGSKVEINETSIKGVITAITIRDKNVIYEVSYFYNGEVKTASLYEIEFSCGQSKTEIGFK